MVKMVIIWGLSIRESLGMILNLARTYRLTRSSMPIRSNQNYNMKLALMLFKLA